MAEEDRAYWKDLFASPTPAPEIRRQLAAVYGIKFLFDHELARFQRWENHWQASLEETERLKDDDLFGRTLSEDTSRSAVRDACLLRTYRRAQVTGDFALGLNAIRHALDIDRAALDEQKFQYDAAAAALKAWAKIKPIAESDLTCDEKIQDLRRRLFGSIPEDNPPATSPAAPCAQPSTSPSVPPVAQPAAVPLNHPATTIAPPATPQHVAKPQPIPSLRSLSAQIAKDGFSQASAMIVATKSLKNYWLELERNYSKSTEPLEANKFYKLGVSTTNKVRQDACTLRDRVLPLVSDPSPGQSAAAWLHTLAQLTQVIAAADKLLEKYQCMIDYCTEHGAVVRFYPPPAMLGDHVAAAIDELEQTASKLGDTIQRKALQQPSV
jgi:hypothetical protein